MEEVESNMTVRLRELAWARTLTSHLRPHALSLPAPPPLAGLPRGQLTPFDSFIMDYDCEPPPHTHTPPHPTPPHPRAPLAGWKPSMVYSDQMKLDFSSLP